jgi:hypothetical protein
MRILFFSVITALSSICVSCLYSQSDFAELPAASPSQPDADVSASLDKGADSSIQPDVRENMDAPDMPIDIRDEESCVPQSPEEICRGNACTTADNCGESVICACPSCDPDANAPGTGCDTSVFSQSGCCSVVDNTCQGDQYCTVSQVTNPKSPLTYCDDTATAADCNDSNPAIRCLTSSTGSNLCIYAYIGTRCNDQPSPGQGPEDRTTCGCSTDLECGGERKCVKAPGDPTGCCNTNDQLTAKEGERCQFIVGPDYITCEPGLYCMTPTRPGPGMQARCVRPCELDTGRGCSASQKCKPTEELAFGLGAALASQGYGFCTASCD